MSEDTDDKDLDLDNDDQGDNDDNSDKKNELEKLAKKIADEQLAEIKKKLDVAYKKLEDTTKENTRLKEDAKTRKQAELEKEGKHLEVARMKLAEYEEKISLLEDKLLSATRDREVEKKLAGLEFRNDVARSTITEKLVKEVVYDEDSGEWKHNSGAKLTDYVKILAKDPDYEFFFKPKDNSGTGSTQNKGSPGSKARPKSLEGLTTSELLELAKTGSLGPSYKP